ncbi:MAG: hypothetical protein VZS44_01305 [Bacilli bacterium]|nr:hypothetical protein [Bacilli bacterium]
MFNDVEMIILSPYDVWGLNQRKEVFSQYRRIETFHEYIEKLKKTHSKIPSSDLAKALSNRKYPYMILTSNNFDYIKVSYSTILENGKKGELDRCLSNGIILPVIKSSSLFKYLFPKGNKNNGILEVEFGEYPQNMASTDLQIELTRMLSFDQLNKTDRKYYLKDDDEKNEEKFSDDNVIAYDEYEYNGKRYVCVDVENAPIASMNYLNKSKTKKVWYEVQPLKWIIDPERELFICKNGILSGIPLANRFCYDGPGSHGSNYRFEDSSLYRFMNKYMVKDILQSVKKQKYGKYPQDIQELLDKINNIVDNLPDNARKPILDKVDKLLSDYDKDLEDSKPKYSLNDEFDIDKKDISMIKSTLLVELEMIVMKLTSEKKAINLLSKLSDYKRLLFTNPKELIRNDDSIDSQINNIIVMINDITSNKKDFFENELVKYIDEAIKEVSKELEKGIDDKPDAFPPRFDADMQLKLNISKLYDNVSLYHEKAIPFEKLLSSLEGKDNLSEIDELLTGINKITSELTDKEQKEEIKRKKNNIIIKYINMIKNIINNDELLKNSNYEKIEVNFRRELQELLLLIKKYNLLEVLTPLTPKKYMNYNYELGNQLCLCKKIIEGYEKCDVPYENSNDIIESTIAELNNDLLDSEIDEEIKKEIFDDLKKILDKYNYKIDNNNIKIKNYEEYSKIVFEILKEIMNVRIHMDMYLKKVKEYNERTR